MPAVSPIADVIVVGLILVWGLTNLWNYLHFCMEKEEKKNKQANRVDGIALYGFEAGP